MEVPTYVPEGNPKIMIIGEVPGDAEVSVGKPFVGSQGNTLRKILTNAGIFHGNCILGNTSNVPISRFYYDTKWTEPTPEFQAQIERLKTEITLYNPNVIVALGAIPMYVLTGEKGIKSFRGTVMPCSLVPGKKVVPTTHPAGIVWDYTLYYQTIMDFRKISHEATYPELPEDKRKLIVAPNRTEIIGYLEWLYENRKDKVIAIDLEHATPGAHISWLGLSHDQNFGFSIQFLNNRQPCFPETDEIEIWSWIAKLFNSSIPQVYHNAGYDVMNLWHNQGVWCKNLHFDTLLAAHVVWPEFPRDLGFLSSIILSVPAWKHTGGKQYEKGEYNAADVANTRGIYETLKDMIDKDEHHSKTFAMEMSEILPAGFMQLQGMSIDTEEQNRLREEMIEQRTLIEEGLNKIMTKPINFSSPKQIADLLYVDLALPAQYKRRKSVKEKRKVTTDEEALTKLYKTNPHPVLKLILEHRKYTKILQFINVDLSDEGKVHTSYNPAGTDTGRWSSSKSIILDYGSGNLQNIDRRIRSMYKAPVKGMGLLQADYKGAEAHVVAHLIGDQRIIMAFDQGLDVHRITAAFMFEVPYDDVTDDQRRVGKTLRHGVSYSAGPAVVARKLDIPKKEAEGFLSRFHHGTPQLAVWHTNIRNQLKKTRTLITPMGRKRTFMGRWDEPLFRSAYAFVPQSTIGDLLNLSMVDFYHNHKHESNMGLAMQLHDAIYIWCHEDEKEHWGKELFKSMNRPIPLPGHDLHIGVDFKFGDDWKNMDSLEVDTNDI